jgi:hypothetical protein
VSQVQTQPLVLGTGSIGLQQIRDVTIWGEAGLLYVVACDANASVGELPHDFLRRPPEEAGYNATKVALMEVLATGVRPFLVTNTLCGPLDDYGSRVLAGIVRALDEVGSDALVNGSDETNMQTSQTGVGVTIVGRGPVQQARLGSSRAGDAVVCVGVPKDGVRVPYREGDPDVAAPRDVVTLLGTEAHELLPVGSKGVAHEVGQLAATAGLAAVLVEDAAVDLHVSAGASTCVLASLAPDAVDGLRAATSLPVEVVAHLVDPSTTRRWTHE